MYQKIFLLGLVLLACEALDDSRSAKIFNYDFQNSGTGPYYFKFQSSDGISREEEGSLSNVNQEEGPAVVVRGSYSYTDNSGKVYTVRYTADENGFHPEGDHIKVPPFVPWVKHAHDEGSSNSGVSTNYYLPSTPSPIPSNQYIPSTVAPAPVSQIRNLDPKLQESILNILANNAETRGIRIEEVNALK